MKNILMKSERYIPALSYDWLTPYYDPVVRLTTRESRFKKALVEQLHSGAADQRLLDLACGTGTLAILLRKSYPQAAVTGIDGDAKILEIARAKAKKAGVTVRLEKGMSFDLPFRDESFDRVASSLFFHHLNRANKIKTLREVCRVLKPGGELHVADWGNPANLLMGFVSNFIRIFDGFETTADNFEGLLPGLIEQAGFQTVEETKSFDTMFGTIRLYRSRKP